MLYSSCASSDTLILEIFHVSFINLLIFLLCILFKRFNFFELVAHQKVLIRLPLTFKFFILIISSMRPISSAFLAANNSPDKSCLVVYIQLPLICKELSSPVSSLTSRKQIYFFCANEKSLAAIIQAFQKHVH